MYIAIDIGGTKTHMAVFEKTKDTLIRESIIKTEQNYRKGINLIVDTIKLMQGRSKLEGVGVSFASQIKDGVTDCTTNIPEWGERDLKKEFETLLGCPVVVVNDAACAGFAEILFGTASNINSFVKLVLGTGLGGVYFEKNSNNWRPINLEVGGMIVERNGIKHKNVKTRGLLEAYVGGDNVFYNYNVDLSKVEDAHKIWDTMAKYLAIGINNICVLLNPEVVYLGGGIIQKRPFLVEKIAKNIPYDGGFMMKLPEIKLSSIEGNASLLGAFALIKQNNETK